MNEHLAPEHLQALADGRLGGTEEVLARRHVSVCPRCGQILKRLEAFDRSLRELPLERAPESLTRSVMQRIGIAPRMSLFLRAVGVLPYLFGLLVVLAVMLTVYVSTGVVSAPGVSPLGSLVAETSAPVRNAVGKGIGTFMELGRGLAGFLGARGVVAAAVPILVALVLVAFVDRFWGRRLLGR